MSRLVARPVGNLIDRALIAVFGGHKGTRGLKTPVTLQILGGIGPFKPQPGTF